MQRTCRCAKSPQVSMPRHRLDTASGPRRKKTFWSWRPRGPTYGIVRVVFTRSPSSAHAAGLLRASRRVGELPS
eukprot:3614234-Prymnesium_polylepis.1